MLSQFTNILGAIIIFTLQYHVAVASPTTQQSSNHLRIVCQRSLSQDDVPGRKLPPRLLVLEQMYTNYRSGDELIHSFVEHVAGAEDLRFRTTFSNDSAIEISGVDVNQLRQISDQILNEARDSEFTDTNPNDPGYMSGSIEGSTEVGYGYLRFREDGERNFEFMATFFEGNFSRADFTINRGEGYFGERFGYRCSDHLLAIEAPASSTEADGATYGTGVSY
jgi:hypothetical protein